MCIHTTLMHQYIEKVQSMVYTNDLTATHPPLFCSISLGQQRPGLPDPDLILDGLHIEHQTLERHHLPTFFGHLGSIKYRILVNGEKRRAAHTGLFGALVIQPDQLQRAITTHHQETTLSGCHGQRATWCGQFTDKFPGFDVNDTDRLCRCHIEDREIPLVAEDADVFSKVQRAELVRQIDLCNRRQVGMIENGQDVISGTIGSTRLVCLGRVDSSTNRMAFNCGCKWIGRQRAKHGAIGCIEDKGRTHGGLGNEPGRPGFTQRFLADGLRFDLSPKGWRQQCQRSHPGCLCRFRPYSNDSKGSRTRQRPHQVCCSSVPLRVHRIADAITNGNLMPLDITDCQAERSSRHTDPGWLPPNNQGQHSARPITNRLWLDQLLRAAISAHSAAVTLPLPSLSRNFWKTKA